MSRQCSHHHLARIVVALAVLFVISKLVVVTFVPSSSNDDHAVPAVTEPASVRRGAVRQVGETSGLLSLRGTSGSALQAAPAQTVNPSDSPDTTETDPRRLTPEPDDGGKSVAKQFHITATDPLVSSKVRHQSVKEPAAAAEEAPPATTSTQTLSGPYLYPGRDMADPNFRFLYPSSRTAQVALPLKAIDDEIDAFVASPTERRSKLQRVQMNKQSTLYVGRGSRGCVGAIDLGLEPSEVWVGSSDNKLLAQASKLGSDPWWTDFILQKVGPKSYKVLLHSKEGLAIGRTEYQHQHRRYRSYFFVPYVAPPTAAAQFGDVDTPDGHVSVEVREDLGDYFGAREDTPTIVRQTNRVVLRYPQAFVCIPPRRESDRGLKFDVLRSFSVDRSGGRGSKRGNRGEVASRHGGSAFCSMGDLLSSWTYRKSYLPRAELDKDKRLFNHPMKGAEYELLPNEHDRCTKYFNFFRRPIPVACFRGLRFLFTGDSQPRTIYRHFHAYFAQQRASQSKGGNLSFTTEYDMKAQFLWDPYLEGLLKDGPHRDGIRRDVLVVGCGPWPASLGQWTYKQYYDRLVAVAKRIAEVQEQRQRLNQRPLLVIWAGNPTWPKWRSMPQFRISNQRMQIFAELGWSALLAHLRLGSTQGVLNGTAPLMPSPNTRLQALDWLQISFPHWKLHRGDGMHYDHSVVLYSTVDVLLSVICAHSQMLIKGGGK